MNPFALIGAVVGGIVGALIWVIAMASTGTGWGGLAVLVGVGSAATAILMGSRPNNALIVAVVTLVVCMAAKGAGLAVAATAQRDALTAELNFDEQDYTRFMDDAVEFTSVQPQGYANFVGTHRYYDTNGDGTGSAEEMRRFQDFWVPRLQLWAATPPTMAQWAPALRDDYAAAFNTKADMGAAARAQFGVLALMAMVLAVVGAYVAVMLISTADASLLDREDRIVAGVIDLNADVGTRINIQMAAPGEKAAARGDKTRITDRVKRASAGRPTGQIIKKPPPKNALRDQPPGMT